jgi:hypothetical protein
MDSEMGTAIANLSEASLANARREAQIRKPQPQVRQLSEAEACARMVAAELPTVAKQAKELARQRKQKF